MTSNEFSAEDDKEFGIYSMTEFFPWTSITTEQQLICPQEEYLFSVSDTVHGI